MSVGLAVRVNGLRTARLHMRAAGGEAYALLERELADAEAQARDVPELAYLFRRRPRNTGPKSGGRTHVLPPQSSKESTIVKEDGMARKSKQAQLEETLEALRKAEKSAGSTKWALSGAGAVKNPPSAERKAHLEAKLAREQALVAELRAKRDELKA